MQFSGASSKALAVFIERGDRAGQAKLYYQLGRVAQEQLQSADAKATYQKTLALFIELNDRQGQAKVYHQLGIVAQEQQQWAESEASYQRALALRIEFNDGHSQASTYYQLGMVAAEQRQWAEAQAMYQKALAFFIEFNDRYSQAQTYSELGDVAAEQGQWAEAANYSLSALQILAETRTNQGVGFSPRTLARLRHKLGTSAEGLGIPLEDLIQLIQIFNGEVLESENHSSEQSVKTSIFRWMRRFGHLSASAMRRLTRRSFR